MTTLASIISQINNGDVPTFSDLSHHFDGLDMWDIRNACFGDASAAVRFCSTRGMKWRLGYDNMATIDDIKVISVTPSHALILAGLQWVEIKRQKKASGE